MPDTLRSPESSRDNGPTDHPTGNTTGNPGANPFEFDSIGPMLVAPLYIMAGFFGVAACITLLILALNFAQTSIMFGPGEVAVALVLAALTAACFIGARKLKAGATITVAQVGFFAFGGFGAVIALIGVIVSFSDPAGIFAIIFGAVFIGAAFLIRKVFTAPEGMKAVAINDNTRVVKTIRGGTATIRHATYLHVPKDATQADVDAMIEEKQRKAIEQRVDWMAGEVMADSVRHRFGLRLGVAIFALITGVLVWAGYAFDEFFYVMAVLCGIVTAILIVAAIMDAIHHRKFGDSAFIMDQIPPTLGSTLTGLLRTGIAAESATELPVTLTLRCQHQREERAGSGDDGRQSTVTDTLWEESITVPAQPREDDPTKLCVPAVFEVPDDQPASSLTPGKTGYFWRLKAHASMPGLDYRSEFTLPVVMGRVTLPADDVEEDAG